MKNDFKGIYINGDTYMTKNVPREIINAFSCIDNELSVCSDELPKIFNYITNLQEEKENAVECLKYYEEKHFIKPVIDNTKFTLDLYSAYTKDIKDLQTRINKAVEYIEEQIEKYDLEDGYNTCMKVIDILRGEE